jgi:hypothetical protein
MNFEMCERQMRGDYAGLAETVATVLTAAIQAQPSLRLQQVQHRAKDPASLKKKLEKASALKSEKIEDVVKDLERGRPQRLQGAGPLGVDRLQARPRLVQRDAAIPLPTPAVEVDLLPRDDPPREVREDEAVTCGRLDVAQAEMPRVGAPPTRTSAAMTRPSSPRVSSARRASRSVPGQNARGTWNTCWRRRNRSSMRISCCSLIVAVACSRSSFRISHPGSSAAYKID